MEWETCVQSQVASYQRILKWYLIPSCLTLSNTRCVSRVKWSNPRKGVAPSPAPRCRRYWKGSLLVALDYSCQLYLLTKVQQLRNTISNSCRIFCKYLGQDWQRSWEGNQILLPGIWECLCSFILQLVHRRSVLPIQDEKKSVFFITDNKQKDYAAKLLSELKHALKSTKKKEGYIYISIYIYIYIISVCIMI